MQSGCFSGRWLANKGTNCVPTKPGMASNAATAGFIDGIGSYPGLLTHVEPGTGCAANGMPATTVLFGKTLNNDTLSCFFTDDTTNIGLIDSPTYTLPGPVLSPAIFNSPRFFFVPVFGTEPSNGTKNYQIVGFRPGFITDQVDSATRMTPLPTGSTNGLTGSGATLSSVQVIFLNPSALPPMPATNTGTFTGNGPRVLVLAD